MDDMLLARAMAARARIARLFATHQYPERVQVEVAYILTGLDRMITEMIEDTEREAEGFVRPPVDVVWH